MGVRGYERIDLLGAQGGGSNALGRFSLADVVFLGETKERPVSFSVRTHSGEYYFKADTDDQTNQWVAHLVHSRDYHANRAKIKQQMEMSECAC